MDAARLQLLEPVRSGIARYDDGRQGFIFEKVLDFTNYVEAGEGAAQAIIDKKSTGSTGIRITVSQQGAEIRGSSGLASPGLDNIRQRHPALFIVINDPYGMAAFHDMAVGNGGEGMLTRR